jgi:hypothetical protein
MPRIRDSRGLQYINNLLGSNSRRLSDPEHGKSAKVDRHKVKSEGVNHFVDSNKCAGFLPLGESLGGLFIGVVRESGNNVRMAPLTTLFT